jgi:transcription-repair coupling factor (superfamily II helicase)
MASLIGTPEAVVAVPDVARAFVVAGIANLSERRPLVVVTPTNAEAERVASDLRAYLGEDIVDVFPAWETLPFERVSPAAETMGRRLRAMWHLRHVDGGSAGGRSTASVLVAPVKAFLQRLGPRVEDVAPVVVRSGDSVDRDELVSLLVEAGYRREYQVEHRGELAVRGGIVDVFPATARLPVRIDLFGDEVDRLTEFELDDQRSVAELDEAEIFGCRELRLTERVRQKAAGLVSSEPWGRAHWERLAQGQVFDGMESWLPWLADGEHLLVDLLGPGALLLLIDPRRMRDRATELLDEEAVLASSLASTWGAAGDVGLPRLHLPFDRLLAHTSAPARSLASTAEGPASLSISAGGWEPVVGDGARLSQRLADLTSRGYAVVVCADGAGSAGRMAARLTEEGLSAHLVVDDEGDSESTYPSARGGRDLAKPGLAVVVCPLERGFVLPSARLAVVSEPDLTGRRRAHRPVRSRPRPTEGFFDDLAPGDFVVHQHHGVARYGGMVTRAIGGSERDYLLLEYRGGDKLYVPTDQIGVVTPYTGGESPRLNRMGGSEWHRARAKVRAAVREVAIELVELYRRRTTSSGHAFSADTPWQRELEDAFPYTETPDQTKAIADVKVDMEQPVPMDRLVCGDVGFGKTEIAIRAAFKAVQDGKQAAVLVPTTLLAQQHLQTFSERFAPFPLRVEALSRFLTPSQARKVVAGLDDGSVDVVIGTHRMLSADVAFKDLGLLVVDEEQRFGVVHKEAVKRVLTGVDVLTLTATPIPRTLEMSLTGIRDLSLLNTAPAERQPILTYVGENDDLAVSEAVRRELLREGQAFVVHNRVRDIDSVARRVVELVPEARVAIAHGQMDEGTLERVVLDFWERQYDVLVCTTIIESGIDMPTVNTLVVDRADQLGLGQLHQLRGRVGRAGQRAYAYLFHPPDRVLSEQAYERLRTVGEHTELGSGFKIAMRDLEIRGAGNILGSDQSGHIAAVGYDLYVQMVSEAVAELKDEERRPPAEVTLDLPLEAHLPSSYVEREDLRLEAYRRLARVMSSEEVDDIRAEWTDRYGRPPAPAENLLAAGRLRAECVRTGVTEVAVTGPRPGSRGSRPLARLGPLRLRASAQVRLRRMAPGATYKENASLLVVPLDDPDKAPSSLVDLLAELVPS